MAKKTTRQRKALAQQRAIQQATANVASASARAEAPAAAPVASSAARHIEPASAEFAYVRADLRRIAILAIGIVATLVALRIALP